MQLTKYRVHLHCYEFNNHTITHTMALVIFNGQNVYITDGMCILKKYFGPIEIIL